MKGALSWLTSLLLESENSELNKSSMTVELPFSTEVSTSNLRPWKDFNT